LRRLGIENRFNRIDLFAFQGWHVVWQPPCQVGKQVAAAEDARKRHDIVEYAQRADLHGEASARCVVAGNRGHGFPDALQRAIVERAGQLFGLDPIIVEQGSIDVMAQRLGLDGDQIAAYPIPDRLQRHARDAAACVGSTGAKNRRAASPMRVTGWPWARIAWHN